jgi:uncharacterized protein (TIGR00255 family)
MYSIRVHCLFAVSRSDGWRERCECGVAQVDLAPVDAWLVTSRMQSMTGFGRGVAARDGWEIAVVLSSVNRKALEVAVSLPREWQSFEPEINAAVREKIARGRVHVALEVHGGAAGALNWDETALESLLDRLAALAAKRGVPFVPTPETFLLAANASRSESASLELEKAIDLIRAALAPALKELVAMRAKEGEALARDITQRAAALAAMVEAIARRAPGVIQNYRESLLQRLRGAGLDLDLNDERVLKEIALFADRIDIAEELTRLRSHFQQLATLVADKEPIGRKAEFLLQEIGREIHTIGSKANDLEIARVVIDFKNELERVREQIQNVE